MKTCQRCKGNGEMKVKRKKNALKIFQDLMLKLLFLCLATSLSSSGASYAQSVKDIIYPNSVPDLPGKSFPRLTKNDIDEVKAFYKIAVKKIQGQSELVETSGRCDLDPGCVHHNFGFRDNVQGTKVLRADAIGIRSVDRDLYFKERDSKGVSRLSSGPAPLRHLQDIVNFRQAGQTQEDYNKLTKQYENLNYAFFRKVEVSPGEVKSEDEVIYEKCYRQVYGEPAVPAKPSVRDDKEKRKRMEETARKIKELRDQGKTREAMELSTKIQQEMKQDLTQAGGKDMMQTQKRAMSKEAWDIWLQCMKEMDTASYKTRIEYGGPLTLNE